MASPFALPTMLEEALDLLVSSSMGTQLCKIGGSAPPIMHPRKGPLTHLAFDILVLPVWNRNRGETTIACVHALHHIGCQLVRGSHGTRSGKGPHDGAGGEPGEPGSVRRERRRMQGLVLAEACQGWITSNGGGRRKSQKNRIEDENALGRFPTFPRKRGKTPKNGVLTLTKNL